MNYGKNIKYFKSTDTLFYIGLPILILGGVLIAMTFLWFYIIPYQILIGFLLAVIGASLAFIPRSLRTSEKELDSMVSSFEEGYAKEITETYNLEKQLLRQIAPYVAASYVYDEAELLMRRGKDDRKWRTSKYSAAAVLCTKNGIVVSHKAFSLIEEMTNETLYEFHYEALDRVFIRDKELPLADSSKIKISHLVFVQDEKEVLALPTVHIIAVDRLADDINRLIAEARKSIS